MPGMSESPFDKVYLVTPAGVEEQLTQRLTEKAKYHFDAQLCTSLDEAVQLAHANTRRGLLVCGSAGSCRAAGKGVSCRQLFLKNNPKIPYTEVMCTGSFIL